MNNLKTFELCLSVADKSVFDYKWLIFREDKLGTDDTELIHLLSKYPIEYEIIHSKKLDDLVKDLLPDVYNSKLYKHLTMNWNFLMTWYIQKMYRDVEKIFAIEEDFFVNINMNILFTLNTNGYVFSSLSLGGVDYPTDKRYMKFKAWLSCVNVELTPKTWVSHVVNKKVWGGPRLHVISKMPEDYENRITRVYTNEVIFDCKSNRWHCGYYDELFHSIIENDNSVQLNNMCKHEMLRKFTSKDCLKWIQNKRVYHFGGSVKNEKLTMIKQLKGD